LEGIIHWYEDEMKQSELNQSYIKQLVQAMEEIGHARALILLAHRLLTGRAGRPPGRPLSTDIQAAIAQAIENIVGNLTP